MAHRDPEQLELAREWARRYPTDRVASRGVSEVIRTGEPELACEIPDERLVEAARDPADLEALRALGLRSYLIVPLIARERCLGAITLVSSGSGRRYGAADVELVAAADGHAELAVADTGPGIPARDLPHIFEPYWTTLRDATRGSGLGLYICKGIVEAHGGRIWADSRPGEGTRITFTLPLQAPDAPG